jgi:hypothetical protein
VLRLDALRLDLVTQCAERGLRRRGCARPEGRDQFAGGGTQIGRQVGMVDAHATLFAQFGPEFAEHRGRRAHAAPPHQLIQTVGGWRDAMTEEQQRADLAIQLAGLRERHLQTLDLDGQRRVGGQDITHEIDFTGPFL